MTPVAKVSVEFAGSSTLLTLLFPTRTLLLALTTAPAPIAVALVSVPGFTSAFAPSTVLLLPVVMLGPELNPAAVFRKPELLDPRAW